MSDMEMCIVFSVYRLNGKCQIPLSLDDRMRQADVEMCNAYNLFRLIGRWV